ncbi:universal stress protein [Chloroflexota bacterium]
MYKKILVPVDGSELTECTLEHVRAIAKGCNVPEVILLRVVEPLRNVYEFGEDWYKGAQEKIQAEAKDYLSKVVAALKKDGITADAVVVSDQPAEAILNYAKRNQVDLIIMSTHGRSGVSRWVIGSVADRVVRHSVAPVLAVSPAGCRV